MRDPLEGALLVGRYEVERVVTRSLQEVVLHARHVELGQRVLLRYLTPEAAQSPEAVVRFQRGARKAREMRSEHAERVVDFGRLEGGNPYRASELPSGPSLAEIVRVRGALPVTEAVDIVMTACEPVAEAHASGIIHRSLGTSNVFLERRSDGSPLVRVLDFGVADPLEPDWIVSDDVSVPAQSSTSDSLPYAAPEQIRNPGAVDARADVWALGAILYELLAGSRLFHAESPLSLLAMIAADNPTPLNMLRDDIPADLETLVLGCLEKDPEARPRSVIDLVLALAAFASVEAQPAAARTARIVTRSTRPPPLPSGGPLPFTPSNRASALVRSRQPSRMPSLTLSSPEPRGWALLFAGAGIGVAAALATALLMRPATVPAVVQVEAPRSVASARALEVAPVVATTLAAAPAVVPLDRALPVPAVAAKPVADPVPAAAPKLAAAPAPAREPRPAPARPQREAAAKPAEREQPSDPKPTAAAEPSLFGGMD